MLRWRRWRGRALAASRRLLPNSLFLAAAQFVDDAAAIGSV
jgi:hypothetical protein